MHEITRNEAQFVAGGTIDSYESAIGYLGGSFGVLGGITNGLIHSQSAQVSNAILSASTPTTNVFVSIFAGVGIGFTYGALIGAGLFYLGYPKTN